MARRYTQSITHEVSLAQCRVRLDDSDLRVDGGSMGTLGGNNARLQLALLVAQTGSSLLTLAWWGTAAATPARLGRCGSNALLGRCSLAALERQPTCHLERSAVESEHVRSSKGNENHQLALAHCANRASWKTGEREKK